MMANFKIDSIVQVDVGGKTEVSIGMDLIDDKKNRSLLNTYIPVTPAVAALKAIIEGLNPINERRAHFITGQYGSGKSHLGLVIANIFKLGGGDKELQEFISKLEKKDNEVASLLRRMRWQGTLGENPFLVVLLDPQQKDLNLEFLRALHIAMQAAGIEEYEIRSHFRAAIEQWNEIKSKPALEAEFNKELKKRGLNPDTLRSKLESYQNEAYTSFQEIIHSVTTVKFLPFDAESSAGPIYIEAARAAKLQNYAGILVIADEFGNHMKEVANDPKNKSAQALQDFVQACNSSRDNQVHFVGITHRALSDYQEQALDAKELEKVAGRFLWHNLDYKQGQEEESVDLIDTIIQHKDSTDKQKQNWAEIKEKMGVIEDWVRDVRIFEDMPKQSRQQKLLLGCYPLHPATVFCLPWMAQRLGQDNRSAIRFLTTDEDGSLVDFIRDNNAFHSDGTLNLYTPEHLLSYFGSNAERHPEWRSVFAAFQTAFGRYADEFQVLRLLQLITVLNIVGQPDLKPTAETLRSVLGSTQAEEFELVSLVEELEAEGVIVKDRRANVYRLSVRGEGDMLPAEAIQKMKEMWGALDFDAGKVINRFSDFGSQLVSEYAKDTGVSRNMVVELVTPKHLENLSSPSERIRSWYEPGSNYEGDLVVWYVLCEDEDSRIRAEKLLTQGTKSPQHIVAIPKVAFTKIEALRNYQAAQQLISSGGKINEEQVDLEGLRQYESSASQLAREAVSEFFVASNFVWHHGIERTESIKDGEEDAFFSRVLKGVFSQNPEVSDAALSPTKATSADRRGRDLAIDKLLGLSGGHLRIREQGGQPEVRILRAALYDTELYEKKNNLGQEIEIDWREKVPANSALAKVWKKLDNSLARDGEAVLFEDVIEDLLTPPFGLPPSLLEVILAAYFRFRTGKFMIVRADREQTFVRLDVDLVKAIVASPQEYFFTYFELRPQEEQWLKEVNLSTPGESTQSGDALERARQGLLAWFENLDDGAKKASDLESEDEAFRTFVASQLNELEPRKTILEVLPNLLGVSDIVTNSVDINALGNRLRERMQSIQSATARKLQLAVEELTTVFGVETKTIEALASGIRDWWNGLKPAQRVHVPSEPSIAALHKVISSGSLDERSIFVELPAKMSLSPYTHWTDQRDLQFFVNQVALAKGVIESYGGEPIRGEATRTLDSSASVKERIQGILASSGLELAAIRELLQQLLDEFE
jgi:hypothetical protein